MCKEGEAEKNGDSYNACDCVDKSYALITVGSLGKYIIFMANNSSKEDLKKRYSSHSFEEKGVEAKKLKKIKDKG